MILSGATVTHNGANHHRLTVGTTDRRLADATAKVLDWLCSGVVVDQQPSNDHNDVYRVSTWSHPSVDGFADWEKLPSPQGRSPPESVDLSPEPARWWYAHAGGMQFSHTNGGATITFSAQGDGRKAWICRLLEGAGFEPVVAQKRVQLPPNQSRRWLDWVGDPVRGSEHKWATNPIVYQTLRKSTTTRQDYQTQLCFTAVETAAQLVSGEVTPTAFNNKINVVTPTEVAETLGGGDWNDALSVAGVHGFKSNPNDDDDSGDDTDSNYYPDRARQKYEYSEADGKEALNEWVSQTDEHTYESYNEYAKGRGDIPSVGWYYDHYDGFRAAVRKLTDIE